MKGCSTRIPCQTSTKESNQPDVRRWRSRQRTEVVRSKEARTPGVVDLGVVFTDERVEEPFSEEVVREEVVHEEPDGT